MTLIDSIDTPAHLRLAASYLGQKETALNDSVFIRGLWAKLVIPWLKSAPWCGGFVACVLKDSGLPYQSMPYRALEWANYGAECTIAHLGCIAVLRRTGGGHVAFVVGQREINGELWVLLLGGNQGDAVTITAVRDSDVDCYRVVPTGKPKVGLPHYPIEYFRHTSKQFA